MGIWALGAVSHLSDNLPAGEYPDRRGTAPFSTPVRAKKCSLGAPASSHTSRATQMSCGCVGQYLTDHCGSESRSPTAGTVLSAGIRPTAVVTVEFSQFSASSGAYPVTAQCQRQRGKTTAEKTDQGLSGQLFQAADTDRTSGD